MKHLLLSLAAMVLLCAPIAMAQSQAPEGKYSIKANANIGLGDAYSASSAISGANLDKSSSTSFGVDFRYRVWKKQTLSMGLNVGIDYAVGSQTIAMDHLNFNYAAGADADMDGDPYQRYTEVNNASQKVSLGELTIPVYLDFDWQFSQRVSLYVNAGLSFRLSTMAKTGDVSGSCDVYGVYPKYDNLKIDDEWLNDFGDHSLSGASVEKPEQNSFTMSIRGGAGLRVWIYGPLSFECGVNYDWGLSNRLKVSDGGSNTVSADNAPITYTVKNGRTIKSFASALNKDKLTMLSLNLGLIFSF